MLKINNLQKVYNGTTVVNVPELSITAGESVGLVGNNGAGKTTLFRMILDLIRPSKGEVFSKDANVMHADEWK
ncbi:MAG: ATP-binding cassette domain-containing protein, partial [Pontibacter sp.]|nr:ATP-binding cassette domain-containing protein [Pontibacter sp.]